jgi:hypothetical protein
MVRPRLANFLLITNRNVVSCIVATEAGSTQEQAHFLQEPSHRRIPIEQDAIAS